MPPHFAKQIESQWAAFFDFLDIPYAYNGREFYLPQQRCWVQCLNQSPTASQERQAAIIATSSGLPVYLFLGPIPIPHPDHIDSALTDSADSAFKFYPDEGEDYQYWWCECTSCGKLGIEFNGRSDRLPCKGGKYPCPQSQHGDKGYNHDSVRLKAAYAAAEKIGHDLGTQPGVVE